MDRVGSNAIAASCCTALAFMVAASSSCDGTGIETNPALARAANAVCSRLEACGCFNLPQGGDDYGYDGYSEFLSTNTCVPTLEGALTPSNPSGGTGYYDDNRDEPAIFLDEQCVEILAERFERTPCGELPIPTCEEQCSLFYGTRHKGEACADQEIELCGRGLACIAGECRDPCDTAGPALVGQACLESACDDGLICRIDYDPDTGEPSGVCVALPAIGAMCDSGECVPEAWCDTSGPMPVCRPLGQHGEACSGHTQCASSYCPAGRCVRAPGEGEACGANSRCDDGLRCDDEGEVGVCRGSPALCDVFSSGFFG